ncbi:hypothetical protein HaLaN_23765 [Haematococcus lacustris]|uniref:Uncharacterized protein n=1 Tax=Haematococcus lacustris TaxID=44745 RepID=A0A699ZSW3_HAELA|nr:hypothetical protein HaLaN_23765 [Haematococcus lacustris]
MLAHHHNYHSRLCCCQHYAVSDVLAHQLGASARSSQHGAPPCSNSPASSAWLPPHPPFASAPHRVSALPIKIMPWRARDSSTLMRSGSFRKPTLPALLLRTREATTMSDCKAGRQGKPGEVVQQGHRTLSQQRAWTTVADRHHLWQGVSHY